MNQARRKRAITIGLTIGTALGSAAVMYAVYPLYFVLIASAVIVAHEFGHYISAVFREGNPQLPFFIPLMVGTVGVTRVKNLPQLSKRARRYIILAGPIGGALAAASMIPLALISGSSSIVFTILITLAWEIFNGTLGPDGKKWRKG